MIKRRKGEYFGGKVLGESRDADSKNASGQKEMERSW